MRGYIYKLYTVLEEVLLSKIKLYRLTNGVQICGRSEVCFKLREREVECSGAACGSLRTFSNLPAFPTLHGENYGGQVQFYLLSKYV